MALRNLTCTLIGLLQPVATGSRQVLSGHQLASTTSGIPQITETLQPRWSLDSWLKSWQNSSWLAVPKKKVSPHRRGMRNAGKHQKLVPVVARCKECNKAFPVHQLARCKAENCPGRFTQAT
ncbi:hypothetical protein WJX82_006494 [Trebouxia sp. C0006]